MGFSTANLAEDYVFHYSLNEKWSELMLFRASKIEDISIENFCRNYVLSVSFLQKIHKEGKWQLD